MPKDFDRVLESYANEGYRILGLGQRKIDSETIEQVKSLEREEVEEKLTFLGFLIM